ncbi:MAG: carboxypeptidase-like regulatory domain-containing protein, partial [Candidatus Thermoplasmatota archaeon]|nr:carboxypeptidase-like regulatory domain-containing protein [Candidatus Thermoplasmatota archaeon]
LSFPLLRNITRFSFPVLTAELYQNESLIVERIVEKPLIGVQYFRFPKLEPGMYHVKIYRLRADNEKKYIGFGAIDIVNDVTLHIYCTWEQSVAISLSDQFGTGISNVSIEVWQGSHLVSSAQSTSLKEVVIPVPFNLFETYQTTDLRNATLEHLFQRAQPYVLKCHYKGFSVFESTLDLFSPSAKISFALYDVIIEVTDALGLPPDVNVVTRITSDEMREPIELHPSFVLQNGRFQFSSIPQASYTVRISFAGYMNEKMFSVPDSGSVIPIQFLALSKLSVQPLTSRGEPLNRETFTVSILRNGNEISVISTDEEARLPPGSYVVLMYDTNRLIGSEFVELTFDKTIPIVTILPSIIYAVVTLIGVFLLAYTMLFFHFKKISLNTALKLVILGVVLVGFLQPWWAFSGVSENGTVEKTSEMYLYPQAMIEEYHVHDYRYLSLATIPEMFTNFVETLLFIIIGGMCLLVVSFIPNVILKKRFAFALSACGVIFLLLVSIAFIVGMNLIAELTVGSLQGSASIQISPPFSNDVMISASWGLGPGFYIVSLGACIAIFAGILDFINKHEIISKLRKNKNDNGK